MIISVIHNRHSSLMTRWQKLHPLWRFGETFCAGVWSLGLTYQRYAPFIPSFTSIRNYWKCIKYKNHHRGRKKTTPFPLPMIKLVLQADTSLFYAHAHSCVHDNYLVWNLYKSTKRKNTHFQRRSCKYTTFHPNIPNHWVVPGSSIPLVYPKHCLHRTRIPRRCPKYTTWVEPKQRYRPTTQSWRRWSHGTF